MRQRLAILILLPCLWLARPAVLAVYGQEPAPQPAPGPGAPLPGQQPPAAAGQAAQPGAPAPPGGALPDAAVPPAEAPPAAPTQKLDKYNDSHSVPRLHSPAISWLKLTGI